MLPDVSGRPCLHGPPSPAPCSRSASRLACPSPRTLVCSTTVFSHSQTVVLCGSCSTVLCTPTGGRARLTEGERGHRPPLGSAGRCSGWPEGVAMRSVGCASRHGGRCMQAHAAPWMVIPVWRRHPWQSPTPALHPPTHRQAAPSGRRAIERESGGMGLPTANSCCTVSAVRGGRVRAAAAAH